MRGGRQRAGDRRRRRGGPGDQRRLPATPSAPRSPMATCRPSTRSRGRRPRSRSSAEWVEGQAAAEPPHALPGTAAERLGSKRCPRPRPKRGSSRASPASRRQPPALERLKLVTSSSCAGADIPVSASRRPARSRYRFDAKVRRAHPALALQPAREGTLRHWRDAFESGTVIEILRSSSRASWRSRKERTRTAEAACSTRADARRAGHDQCTPRAGRSAPSPGTSTWRRPSPTTPRSPTAAFEPGADGARLVGVEAARAACTGAVQVVDGDRPLWARDGRPPSCSRDGRRRGRRLRLQRLGEESLHPYDQDAEYARRVLEHLGTERRDGRGLEGGSIAVDGEGTALITTEQCLLHRRATRRWAGPRSRRGSSPSSASTGVVWLGQGLLEDTDTDRHVDNVCAVASWPGPAPDAADPANPSMRSVSATPRSCARRGSRWSSSSYAWPAHARCPT